MVNHMILGKIVRLDLSNAWIPLCFFSAEQKMKLGDSNVMYTVAAVLWSLALLAKSQRNVQGHENSNAKYGPAEVPILVGKYISLQRSYLWSNHQRRL